MTNGYKSFSKSSMSLAFFLSNFDPGTWRIKRPFSTTRASGCQAIMPPGSTTLKRTRPGRSGMLIKNWAILSEQNSHSCTTSLWLFFLSFFISLFCSCWVWCKTNKTIFLEHGKLAMTIACPQPFWRARAAALGTCFLIWSAGPAPRRAFLAVGYEHGNISWNFGWNKWTTRHRRHVKKNTSRTFRK